MANIQGPWKAVKKILRQETPCDKCVFFQTCKHEHMACSAFVAYLNHRRWTNKVRKPTSKLFQAIYAPHSPEEYEALDRYLASAEKRTVCAVCAKEFEGASQSRYCSDACRTRAFVRRRKAQAHG